MTFDQQLWLTVLDKGLLALGLALVAGLVKWFLQRDQSQRDLVREIASKRADAYQNLWKKTERLRETEPPELTRESRAEILNDLHNAYFDDGAAMYLSHRAAALFLQAKAMLNGDSEDKAIRQAFSKFRTQLKRDLLIYSKREASTPLLRSQATSD